MTSSDNEYIEFIHWFAGPFGSALRKSGNTRKVELVGEYTMEGSFVEYR